jgi:glycopeptide antibiotics resistance protein
LADDWKIKYNVLFIFLTTFLFETIQFIFRLGAFDITDVITNTLGGAIGLLLFQSSQKLVNDRNKVQRAINIIASLGTLVMISFLVLLKLNLLPIRYQ